MLLPFGNGSIELINLGNDPMAAGKNVLQIVIVREAGRYLGGVTGASDRAAARLAPSFASTALR